MSLQTQIFNQGTLITNRRLVKVGICKTDKIVYDSIEKIVEIEAKLENERLLVFPPKYPQGIYPGVFKGLLPVLKPADFNL